MKRRILCFVLTMAMVLSMLVVVPAVTVSADTYNASDNPVIITTNADWAAFASAVNGGTTFEGKTVKLAGDITVTTAAGSGGDKSFRGSFDGQNHTVTISQSFTGDPDGCSGMFGYVRTPASGTITFQNVKTTGTITLTGSGNSYICSGFISAVDGNTSGSGGTINISNVWSAVDFNNSRTGVQERFGGIVGFPRHASGVKPITINIDSCVYSGTMTISAGKAVACGGIFGGTGNNVSGRSVVLNVTNCLVSGSFAFANVSNPDDFGVFVGYPKTNAGNGTVAVTVRDCISTATYDFMGDWSSCTHYADFGIAYGEVTGDYFTGTVTNLYYVDVPYGDETLTVVGSSGGSKTTVTNAVAKTLSEIKALTASDVTMTDTSKWYFGTSDEIATPTSIYDSFGVVGSEEPEPSIFDDLSQKKFVITTDAEMAEFAALVTAGTDFAGKTIKLGADVNLNTTIGRTGNSSGRQPFSGNFDGQGYTVTITQSISNPEDDNSGLFAFVRIPANETVTIKDVHVTGTVTLTNSTTGKGYCGGLIGCLDAGKSGDGGTIEITNVWNTVRINCGNTNAWSYIGGMIGFTRHEDGLKPLTINIDSCVWDGVINSGPAIYNFGGYVGFTGNNKAGRTLEINITNSVSAGTFQSNSTWNQQFGTIIGYAKGSNSNDDTAKVTVNIENVISTTKAIFAHDTGSGSLIGLVSTVDGTTELNLSNIYYKTFERTGVEGDFPVVASGKAATSDNVVEKTTAKLLELTASDFTDSTKWDKTDSYYPCPVGIVNAFGETPNSLYVEQTDINISTADALNALATAVNGGKTYEGKTIHLKADISVTDWSGIGMNSSKPFKGNFDGHGHTVDIQQTLSNPDGPGGFIALVEIPDGETLEIKNLHLTGRVNMTNTTTGCGYFGAVITAVHAKEGSGGTLNVSNVWSSVYINCGNTNAWAYIGGIIGFFRQASGLKPLTVNMDSCLWDGTINAGPALYNSGGFVGCTGHNPEGRTLELNITNSVAAGTIAINQNYDVDDGILIGYAKGVTSSATTVINISNVLSVGKMTFKDGTPGSGSNIGHIGKADGVTEVNMTNLYYNAFKRGVLEGNAPAIASCATTPSETNVIAKDAAGAYALKTSDLDSSKWTKQTGYYVCPTGLIDTFGTIPSSLQVDVWEVSDEISIGTTAEFLAFRDKVNNGTTFAGKTITLTADIDLDGEDWTAIGTAGGTGSVGKAFCGTFDGDGHTISNLTTLLEPTSGNVDMKGGLFGSLGDGAVVKNFYLTGTITIRNYSAGSNTDYFGSVATAVGGTVLIQNVHSSVNFNTSNHQNPDSGTWAGAVRNVGGLVGFIFHRTNTDLIIDSCTYSGTINPGNSAENYAGIIAYTGSNEITSNDVTSQASTKTVTITNSAFTGRMTINGSEAYLMQGIAGIIGKVTKYTTVNITGTHSAGKIYFNSTKNWPITDDENPIKMGQILGYNEDGSTVNIDSTVTYVPAKLNQTSGDDSTKYVLPEAGRLDGVYAADTDAVIGGMEASFEARNVEDDYKGIRFKATFYTTSTCTGGGTQSANFGIYLLTKETYTLLGGATVTKAQLDAAGSTVVQVKATKYVNNTSNYVVNAVVYNLNTATRQATELVAIPYAGDTLGTAASTTYNALFN